MRSTSSTGFCNYLDKDRCGTRDGLGFIWDRLIDFSGGLLYSLRKTEMIQRLILVAGLVLKPGERAIDRIPESRRASYFELAEASNDRSFRLSPEVTARVFFNDCRNFAKNARPNESVVNSSQIEGRTVAKPSKNRSTGASEIRLKTTLNFDRLFGGSGIVFRRHLEAFFDPKAVRNLRSFWGCVFAA